MYGLGNKYCMNNNRLESINHQSVNGVNGVRYGLAWDNVNNGINVVMGIKAQHGNSQW